ncbi:MAG: hypothetical protein H6502_01365 [Candidatus Woesearchaeota archaeon]|nr:MAG: hypothetical protein H6502_01365 [Candidatus Woesearchaeota archaeon]
MVRTLWLVFMLLLFLVPVISYEQGITLIRPENSYLNPALQEYITNEDLFFVACTEDPHVLKTAIVCLDDNRFEELDNYRFSETENCFVAGTNLEDFSCHELQIQAEYTVDGENQRLSKVVKVNKLSKLLDIILETQYSDGGWSGPLDTAYGIWALSHFSSIFSDRIEDGLDWLKLNRHNDDKCWPKSPCDHRTTAEILSLLTLSNLNADWRDVNDGTSYLELEQSYFVEGETWTIRIFPVLDDTTLSLVASGSSVLDQNFSLPDEDYKEYNVSINTGDTIAVLADEVVITEIFDARDKRLLRYQGDNVTYDVPGPCWSETEPGDACDPIVTAYAAMTAIPATKKTAALDWLDDQRIEDPEVVGNYVGSYTNITERSLASALFLYHAEHSLSTSAQSNVLDYLLFSQNNEGSWGHVNLNVSNKTVPSAFSVLALLENGFNRSYEPIVDAEDYFSLNEEDIEDNDTQSVASAFYILNNNNRPLLVTDPSVLLIDRDVKDITLLNPTTFDFENLEYELSDSLTDYLDVVEKTVISAYSYRKITFTRKKALTKSIYGFFSLYEDDEEVARIPVIVADTPHLNMTIPKTLTVFGTAADLQLTMSKSHHQFTCEVTWVDTDISSQSSFSISSDSFSLPINFESPETTEQVHRGTIVCSSQGMDFSYPINLLVTRYAAKPFTVRTKFLQMNDTSKQAYLIIKNNLDRDVVASIKISPASDYISFPSSERIDPGAVKNITFRFIGGESVNITDSFTISIEAFDNKETATLAVTVVPPPQRDLLVLFIVLAFVLIILGAGAYAAYRFKDQLIALINKLNFVQTKKAIQKTSADIHELKDEERNQAIINIYNISKFKDRSDADIIKQLQKNFSRKQMKEALETIGVTLAGVDEEEPEKL